MTIEERLQELRKGKGLSQEQLADRLGVSRQAVSKWESGQSLPEIEKLIVISELFEVTLDYILKGEEPSRRVLESLLPSRFASQIVSAVATMLFLVGIISAVSDGAGGSVKDVYGGLVIVSVGIMFALIGWFLAGGRELICKPLFVLNILLSAVLPSMMVPISLAELKGEGIKLSVEWFYRTPGVFMLFTATYFIVSGIAVYFGIFYKKGVNTEDVT